MKCMTTFAQLRLRFHVREFTRRHGRKPSRSEYFRLRYQLDADQQREAARARLRRKAALWLIEELRKA